jgi:hypothetical protein
MLKNDRIGSVVIQGGYLALRSNDPCTALVARQIIQIQLDSA